MRHLRLLSLSVLTAVSLVAAAGCSIGKIDAGTIDLTPHTAPIRYNGDRSIDTPIATGSTSSISVDLPEGTSIASAKIGDTSIASLGAITTYGASRNLATLPVSAKRAGSTTFVVVDDTGKEVARATLNVADTKVIRVDGDDGLTLVSGAGYTVHATTMGDDGVVLVGDGAIAFEATGSLVTSGTSFAFCFGDCGAFETKGVGDGHLHIVAKGASADRVYHVVDRAAIDALTFAVTNVSVPLNKSTIIPFSVYAGGTAVSTPLGMVSCASADPAVATVDWVDWPGALGDATEQISVSGHASGATTVTCTVGSNVATAQVTVP